MLNEAATSATTPITSHAATPRREWDFDRCVDAIGHQDRTQLGPRPSLHASAPFERRKHDRRSLSLDDDVDRRNDRSRAMQTRSRPFGSSLPIVFAMFVGIATICVSAQDGSLRDVMTRAGAYVATFNNDLARIVAEERYLQTWSRPSVIPGTRGDAVTRRELLSDLMLVKPAPSPGWMQYRDVYEVDGVSVRDRAERLSKLFLVPSSSMDAQIKRILDESARHNLGDIERNFNTPVFALQFLETPHQQRFKFTRADARKPAVAVDTANDSGAFRVSTEVWVIRYEERVRPTIVRTPEGKDVPAHGRFWIEPDSGRVLMSELIVGDRDRQGTVTVSYQSEPYLGLQVPIEMHERYDQPRTKSRIEGVATYGRFRKIDEPKGSSQ